MLLKQKEAIVLELERLLNEEKSNSNEQIKENMAQFQKDFESLKRQHQIEINEKQAWMETTMIRIQIQPQLEKFIKEALDINAKLKKKEEVFCHQASMIDSYCDSNKILIQ